MILNVTVTFFSACLHKVALNGLRSWIDFRDIPGQFPDSTPTSQRVRTDDLLGSFTYGKHWTLNTLELVFCRFSTPSLRLSSQRTYCIGVLFPSIFPLPSTLPFDFWLSSRIYWHFFLTKLSIGFPPLHLELLICAICFLSIKTCLVWVTRSLLLWLHAMHRKSTSHLTHDNQKGCPTRRIVYEWALAMSHGRSGILSLGFVEPPER